MAGKPLKSIPLKQFLADNDVSYADFGRKIGTTAQAVHRYAIGARMPQPHIAAAIVRATFGRVTHDELNRAYLAYRSAEPLARVG